MKDIQIGQYYFRGACGYRVTCCSHTKILAFRKWISDCPLYACKTQIHIIADEEGNILSYYTYVCSKHAQQARELEDYWGYI